MKNFFSLCLSALLLTGCGVKTPTNNQETATPQATVPTANTESLTIPNSLSANFAPLAATSIVPFYNVGQDTKFVFHFADQNLEPSKAVTVHTDPSCKETSLVYQINDGYITENGLDVVVKPGSPVLNTSSREDIELANYNWGNAPVYYLSLNYDLEAKNSQPLSEPVVIPFTIKREISTPNVNQKVDNNGVYYLTWKPVDGAVKYNIYSALRVRPESKARELTRSEAGYAGDNLTKIATVSETEFKDWENNFVESNNEIFSQNNFGLDTYYVTAVDGSGHESSFSLGMTAWKEANIIPKSVANSIFPKGESGYVEEFPDSIGVSMADGSIVNYPVSYEKVPTEYDDIHAVYKYHVKGTCLSGHFDYYSESGDYPATTEGTYQPLTSDIYKIEDMVNIIPENTVNYENFDNNSNGLIERVYEDSQIKGRKLQVLQESLLERADIENARRITDGVYPENHSPKDIAHYVDPEDRALAISEVNNGASPTVSPEASPTSDAGSSTPQPSQSDFSTTPAPTVEPAQSTPAPTVEPAQSTPAPTVEPVQSTPEPTVEPVQNTPEPTAEPVQSTPEPTAEPAQVMPEQTPEPPSYTEQYSEFPMFAENLEDAYIAQALINHEERIPLLDCPSLLNAEILSSAITRALYQNPYAISVVHYSLDTDNQTYIDLIVEYGLSKKETVLRQNEIQQEATRVVNEIIKPGMSDTEKARAIYDYLGATAEYDFDVLEKALADPSFDPLRLYPDTFNTYGILCKHKGVCQSYSFVYSLLASMAGLDCRLVTGTSEGIGHAWNTVNIDGDWVLVDSTNNFTSEGIPYWIFQTSSNFARFQGIVADDRWEYSYNLYKGNNPVSSQDPYYKDNRYATSINELGNILSQKYDGSKLLVKLEGLQITDINDLKPALQIAQQNGFAVQPQNISYMAGIVILE